MGQSISTPVQYCVPVSEKKDGETCIYRNPHCVDEMIKSPFEDISNLQQLWLQTVDRYGNDPCVFQRNAKGIYKSKTYKEVHEIGQQLGSGIINLNLASKKQEYKDLNLQMVGIYAKNRQEWLYTDVGCGFLYGMTIVPLYDTLGPENFTYCVNHSNFDVIIASSPSLDNIVTKEDIGSIKSVICLDNITEEQQKKADERGLKLYTFQQILDAGKQNIQPFAKVDPSTILTFSYTSGTTGNPKAAMLSHGNFVSVAGIFYHSDSLLKVINNKLVHGGPIVHLSYLPLPHVMERIVVIALLHVGAEIYMYGGDVNKLKDDLRDVRPTIFVSVPRLYNKFYDKIKEGFAAQPPVKKALINMALNAKLRNVTQHAIYDHALWDKLVFGKIQKDIFGGRVQILISGSAPLAKDVQDFMSAVIGAPMCEGYGQTEGMGGSFLKSYKDPLSGHVGGPTSNVEFKLVDIPEMNYLSTDKNVNGVDCPRGEICLRGPGVFQGYYKDQEKTDETVDSDGWLHSGDVGLLDTKETHLKIIDRKKNIFKLSQGEYIAPEKIENVYRKVAGIEEVFIYGDSLQSTLVGIITPEQNYIEQLGKKLEITGTFQELCQNAKIRKEVLTQITAQGKADKLFGFEQAKALHLEPASLAEKDCYTNTMKLQRHAAKLAFKEEIAKLYEGLQ